MGERKYRRLMVGGYCAFCNKAWVAAKGLAKDRKYCCDGCARAARPRATYTCKVCSVAYSPRHIDRKDCCSRECGFVYAGFLRSERAWKPPFSKVYCRKCPQCNKDFISRSARLIRCSAKCADEYRDIYHKKYWTKKTQTGRVYSCCHCKVEYCVLYGVGSKMRACSDECSAANLKELKRAHKHKRRAMLRLATVKAFKPIDVFRRDNWICRGCGCHTPEHLRGTLHDNAPELDHIVALARGGEHSKENTQTLCRICNQLKSDKTMDELIIYINDLQGYSIRCGVAALRQIGRAHV